METLRFGNWIELTTLLSDTLPEYQVSRARQEKLTKEMREIICDFWKVSSVVSVHRSNNRHIVSIAKENIITQTVNLIDNDMPKEVFHPYQLNSSSILPGGKLRAFIIFMIYRFKTFLCKSTHNKKDGDEFVQWMGSLHNAINEKDELPYSLIDFLCKNFRCARNHKTNFFQWKCLMGNFENECHITSSIQLGGIGTFYYLEYFRAWSY